MSKVITAPREQVFSDVKNSRIRHIVEKHEDGSWADKALCGFLWDMLKPPPNGTLCEECEAELKRKLGV